MASTLELVDGPAGSGTDSTGITVDRRADFAFTSDSIPSGENREKDPPRMPPVPLIDPAAIDTSHVLVDREGIARHNPQRFEMIQLTAIILRRRREQARRRLQGRRGR